MKYLPKASGVYLITCVSTGKIYVGSTVNIFERARSHIYALRKQQHRSKYLQHTFNKYGEGSLHFKVLATCPLEYCIKLEQWFMDTLKPDFNHNPIAGTCAGRILTEEHRKNISAALFRSTRKANWGAKKGVPKSNGRTGYKPSESTRSKISKTLTGRSPNKESIAKTAEAHRIKVEQLTLEGVFIRQFNSIKEAALLTGVNKCSISLHLSGQYKSAGGFLWKRIQ